MCFGTRPGTEQSVQWRPQAIGTESLITRRLEYRVDPSPEGAVGVPPRRSFGGKGGIKLTAVGGGDEAQ